MKFKIKKQAFYLLKSTWFITLFATTLGVLLALYLNNLNVKRITDKNKTIALENLKTELSNNAKELSTNETNDSLFVFLKRISELNNKIPTELRTTNKIINPIAKQYPNFIKIIDSIEVEKNEYTYHVDYKFELSLDDIQNVAWETSKISNITNEFDYDCLNSLVKTYDLQELYIVEQQKLLNYFVNSEHDKLFKAISINQQLRFQLLKVIEETKSIIKNCG